MKKMMKQVVMIMVLLTLSLSTGCSGEDAAPTAESLDLTGTYTGTMTLGQVQVVYDYDIEDKPREPYAAEEENAWEGTTNDVTITMERIDESTAKLTFSGNELSYEGAFDASTNVFTYQYVDEDFESMKNTLTLSFEEADGVIHAHGKLIGICSLPELSGLSNEMIFDLVKSE